MSSSGRAYKAPSPAVDNLDIDCIDVTLENLCDKITSLIAELIYVLATTDGRSVPERSVVMSAPTRRSAWFASSSLVMVAPVGKENKRLDLRGEKENLCQPGKTKGGY